MNNGFKEYRLAKSCLYKMVLQFYTTSISLEEANNRNISVFYEDLGYNNSVEVCFHDFKSDGILAWNYLDLYKDYISKGEIWDKLAFMKYEHVSDSYDYRKDYLRICILLIDMVLDNCLYKTSLEEAIKENASFDKHDDVFNDEVYLFDRTFDDDLESVWALFGFDNKVVGRSSFENKREKYVNELLNKKDKIRKLIK